MQQMNEISRFDSIQSEIVNNSSKLAEELVSDYYKMSKNQWLQPKYDIKTIAELEPGEIVFGPFAQIIKYKGQKRDTSLGSLSYDFYKICIQDHSIISIIEKFREIKLFPFLLYIITHELIHIVRFSKFLQNFEASHNEKMKEEKLVHNRTCDILHNSNIPDLSVIFDFYSRWRAHEEIT